MAVTTRSKTAKMLKTNLKKCRRISYKKHRKSSVCRGVRTSAVCKRTKGCTYAKGKKRSFCRTKKNRKSRCSKLDFNIVGGDNNDDVRLRFAKQEERIRKTGLCRFKCKHHKVGTLSGRNCRNKCFNEIRLQGLSGEWEE